ncbi:hypothetical protein [Bacillus sp. 1NLA3E]|uniref:hypothetical protein n=1 Tax=Bacillus sp. 1NLA3E TaxID=666686 RepID=UPI000247E708|nr:hypothetical protein [Bacillus sp. 1NLA3E]AGK54902.1 hypothetical protein B1NLA3E_15780 [Bacillus sp. 1NLA3E]
MEQATVDFNRKIFRVKELSRYHFDKNNVYAMGAKFTKGDWELTVSSAPADNDDIPYILLNDSTLTERVILEALPILIQKMERTKMNSIISEEILFYDKAVQELDEIYYKLLIMSLG